MSRPEWLWELTRMADEAEKAQRYRDALIRILDYSDLGRETGDDARTMLKIALEALRRDEPA